MNFELQKDEIDKLDDWKKAIKKIHGEYGLYEYRFTPNGIGIEIAVYSHLSKTTIDLTDVNKW